MADEPWFRESLVHREASDYAVADIARRPELGNRAVATYAAAIREGGVAAGRVIGVLAVFFDWETQSRAVGEGVRLDEQERKRTTCYILDSRHRILAASDRLGELSERHPLPCADARDPASLSGSYQESSGNSVGYCVTPGYETYQGLGWFGVVSQRPVELK